MVIDSPENSLFLTNGRLRNTFIHNTMDNIAPIFPEFPDGYKFNKESNTIEEITLVPYECTTLRITQFPTFDME